MMTMTGRMGRMNAEAPMQAIHVKRERSIMDEYGGMMLDKEVCAKMAFMAIYWLYGKIIAGALLLNGRN